MEGSALDWSEGSTFELFLFLNKSLNGIVSLFFNGGNLCSGDLLSVASLLLRQNLKQTSGQRMKFQF